MNLICPICLNEYPINKKTYGHDIKCPCGGKFSFSALKWTYKKPRLKELPPVTRLKDFTAKGTKEE